MFCSAAAAAACCRCLSHSSPHGVCQPAIYFLADTRGRGYVFLAVPRCAPLPQLLCRERPRARVMWCWCPAGATYCRCVVVLLLAAGAAAHVCDMFSLPTPVIMVMQPNPSRCLRIRIPKLKYEIHLLRNCIVSQLAIDVSAGVSCQRRFRMLGTCTLCRCCCC